MQHLKAYIPSFITLNDLTTVIETVLDDANNQWTETSIGNTFLNGASGNKVDGNKNSFDGVNFNDVKGKYN